MSIEYRKEGKIALITINRPEALNALSVHTLAELNDNLEDFCADPHLRVGIITGAGTKSFCSGMDLKSTVGVPTNELFGEGTFVRGLEISKPLIAAINGYAFGGGLEIALACDIRIASHNAILGLPEVSVGLVPGWGGTQRLPRLLPFGKAVELILMGKRITADEAHRLNMVNEVVPVGSLIPAAMEWANQIADFDPIAVHLLKESMTKGRNMALNDALVFENELVRKLDAFRVLDEGHGA